MNAQSRFLSITVAAFAAIAAVAATTPQAHAEIYFYDTDTGKYYYYLQDEQHKPVLSPWYQSRPSSYTTPFKVEEVPVEEVLQDALEVPVYNPDHHHDSDTLRAGHVHTEKTRPHYHDGHNIYDYSEFLKRRANALQYQCQFPHRLRATSSSLYYSPARNSKRPVPSLSTSESTYKPYESEIYNNAYERSGTSFSNFGRRNPGGDLYEYYQR